MTNLKNSNIKLGISAQLEFCHICGSKRSIVQLNDIPKRDQKIFKEALMLPEFLNARIVFCNCCCEYSLVSRLPTYVFKENKI